MMEDTKQLERLPRVKLPVDVLWDLKKMRKAILRLPRQLTNLATLCNLLEFVVHQGVSTRHKRILSGILRFQLAVLLSVLVYYQCAANLIVFLVPLPSALRSLDDSFVIQQQLDGEISNKQRKTSKRLNTFRSKQWVIYYALYGFWTVLWPHQLTSPILTWMIFSLMQERIFMEFYPMDEYNGESSLIKRPARPLTLERKDSTPDTLLCVVCCDRTRDRFLPCGHMVVCTPCLTLCKGSCPVCRKTFSEKQTRLVYL